MNKTALFISLTAFFALSSAVLLKYNRSLEVKEAILNDAILLIEQELVSSLSENELLQITIAELLSESQDDKREIQNLGARIQELESALAIAENLVDPDTYELTRIIKKELQADFGLQLSEMERMRNQVSIMNRLSTLSESNFDSVIRVNGLYGEFINSLDVDGERKEFVVDAFLKMAGMQNAAMAELGKFNPETKEEIEMIVAPILDRELVYDVMSEYLSVEELELFRQYQENNLIDGIPVRPGF